MKAMILAAGLGTRLRPLTNDRPKALVEVDGRPLLEWTILKLKSLGYTELVINVHHFADKIEGFLAENDQFGLTIQISDERAALLETGGGLHHAAPLLEGKQDFLLCNADILTDLDLVQLRTVHRQTEALATLAVSERATSRYLLFDESGLLCGWKNIKTGQIKEARKPQGNLKEFAFSGHHYLSPQIFPLITEQGKFSIIDLYLRLAQSHEIRAFDHTGANWADMGKPETLLLGPKLLRKMTWSREVQDSARD